jgi:hypothetical protein
MTSNSDDWRSAAPRGEMSASYASWPGLSRPSTSLGANNSEDCHDFGEVLGTNSGKPFAVS